MAETVSEAELITTAIDHRMIDWHTAMPGRVERYYPERNTVDVLPMLSARIPTDDDDVVIDPLPVIPDVKLVFQRAGGFGITFPVKAGDYVLLVFCEAPLGAWRQTGNAGDPEDPERLGLSGAVAIPGIYPDAQNIASPDTSNMVIGKLGTPSAQIEITPTEVHLGAGATDFVALASKVATELEKIATAFNSHVHVVTGTSVTGGNVTATAAAPADKCTTSSVAAVSSKAK